MIIRRTTPDDAAALQRLAALDSKKPLRGDALVAVVDGEPRAALSLSGDEAIADPFHPSAELVALLELRLAQLAAPANPPRPARASPAAQRARGRVIREPSTVNPRQPSTPASRQPRAMNPCTLPGHGRRLHLLLDRRG